MITYNVTFIHSYWNLSTTVDAPNSSTNMEIMSIAEDYILETSGFDVKSFRYLDVEVEYVGELND